MEWTFDPLEIKNAFFNTMRLGAVVRRYVLNQYGITTSGLHGSLPTDRCICEWFMDSPWVKQTLAGEPRKPPATEKTVEVVVVELGGQPFALEAAQVREAVIPRDLTPLPGVPAFVRGLVNVRSRVVPAFDLRPLLRLTRASRVQPSSPTRIATQVTPEARARKAEPG